MTCTGEYEGEKSIKIIKMHNRLKNDWNKKRFAGLTSINYWNIFETAIKKTQKTFQDGAGSFRLAWKYANERVIRTCGANPPLIYGW